MLIISKCFSKLSLTIIHFNLYGAADMMTVTERMEKYCCINLKEISVIRNKIIHDLKCIYFKMLYIVVI